MVWVRGATRMINTHKYFNLYITLDCFLNSQLDQKSRGRLPPRPPASYTYASQQVITRCLGLKWDQEGRHMTYNQHWLFFLRNAITNMSQFINVFYCFYTQVLK